MQHFFFLLHIFSQFGGEGRFKGFLFSELLFSSNVNSLWKCFLTIKKYMMLLTLIQRNGNSPIGLMIYKPSALYMSLVAFYTPWKYQNISGFRGYRKTPIVLNGLTHYVLHHMEISQLICSANQLTGIYMMGNTGR